MPRRTILLASLQAPPSVGSGARRPGSWAKELTRLGHRVIVLTSVFSGSGPVPDAARTVRTRDLMKTRFNYRAGQVETRVSTGAAVEVAPPSRFEHYLIPDVQVATWAPFAVARALSLVRETPVDAVVTTGPPHSGHLVGLAVHTRHGLPWLADLQDGWTFDAVADRGLAASSALGRWIERAVLGRADRLTAISAPMADDLAQRFGQGEHLTLAFDPDEMAEADTAAAAGRDALLRSDRVTLLYTGTIVEIPDAARALWQGVRRLRERRPDAARLEVLVVGAVLGEVARDAEELGVGDLVRFEPSVDRVRALALQRQADALLVLARDDRPTVLTNKLVEYLVAGPPVLVVGAQSEAGRLVRERGAGAVLSSEDPDGIAAALGQLLDGTLPRATPSDLEDLSSTESARRLARLLEDVLPPS